MVTTLFGSNTLLRKITIVAALSLLLTTHQAKANKTTTGGALIFVAVFISFIFIHYKASDKQHLFFNKNVSRQPKIIYKIEDSNDVEDGSEVVFIPEIHHDQYIDRSNFEWTLNTYLGKVFCNPVLSVQGTSVDLDSVAQKCRTWFQNENFVMLFPHQVLDISIDKLDTLLLPKLVYYPDSQKFELLVTKATFRDSKDNLDPLLPRVSNGKKNKWVHLIPEMSGYQPQSNTNKKPFYLCHHAPEVASMDTSVRDKKMNRYYSFSVPGISHLHRTGTEFYIATINSYKGPKSYYWELNKPWPNSPQPVFFSKPQLGH